MQIARETKQTVFRRNNNGDQEYEESIAWEVQNAISLDAARRCGDKESSASAGTGTGTPDPKKERCMKCGGKHPTHKHLELKELQKKRERDEDRRAHRCSIVKSHGSLVTNVIRKMKVSRKISISPCVITMSRIWKGLQILI